MRILFSGNFANFRENKTLVKIFEFTVSSLSLEETLSLVRWLLYTLQTMRKILSLTIVFLSLLLLCNPIMAITTVLLEYNPSIDNYHGVELKIENFNP